MEPDAFDTDKLPFGKEAGANKFNFVRCPACKKDPTHPTPEQYPWSSQIPASGFFLFRDELSAQEYFLSGLCQACQDRIWSDGGKT